MSTNKWTHACLPASADPGRDGGRRWEPSTLTETSNANFRNRGMTERLWCTACGTVTRDMICDCNRWNHKPHRDPQFVNYADAMQETAHKQAQQIDILVKALEECAIRCRYDGDLFHDQGNEMRRDASWRAADMATAALSLQERKTDV